MENANHTHTMNQEFLSSFRSLVFILCLFGCFHTYAQQEASNWYFGNHAAVVFNNDGTVTALTNSKMNTHEGCASISDRKGKLLFYTNGINIWNNQHLVMSNGTGLLGNSSSTQSAIIVPKPKSGNVYYVFTVNGFSGNPKLGAYYSEVDMSLNGGMGAVTKNKNQSLLAYTDEKITAVKHANGLDIWVIIPERFSTKIHTFLVTENGVQTSPVSSNMPCVMNGKVGYMKCSPNGTKIAMALSYQDTVLMANFNHTNGTIDSVYSLQINRPYGLEFSPDNRLLYVSRETETGEFILQFDLAQNSESLVRDSKYAVFSNDSNNKDARIFALQLAINQKIYFTEIFNGNLGVIDYPNKMKNSCQLRLDAVNLKGKKSKLGLPTFVQSTFMKRFLSDFKYTTIVSQCKYDVSFSLTDTNEIQFLAWDFGDSSHMTSHLMYPTHQYDKNSTHVVTLFIQRKNQIMDTITKTIDLPDLSNAFQFSESQVYSCPGMTKTLEYQQRGASYLWSTGEKSHYILVKVPGYYHLTITDSNGCKYLDTLLYSHYKVLKPSLGPDRFLCSEDSCWLAESSGNVYVRYLWSTGKITKTIVAKPGKRYMLEMADSHNCKSSDTIDIYAKPYPAVNLGKDTTLCSGQFLSIGQRQDSSSYLWQDGDTSAFYTVRKMGLYTLEINRNNCLTRDDIKVSYLEYPLIDLGFNDSFCGRFAKILDAGEAGRYLWNTGETSRFITARQHQNYWVRSFNQQCMSTDTIVFSAQHQHLVFIPDAFTPNNDLINDALKPSWNVNVREFSIYNAWGEKIYYSTENNAEWDGTCKGANSPDAVYLLCLTYTDCLNRIVNIRKTIHLLR